MLVLVCGLPGSGKSTVAAAVNERLSGELLRTDEIRKALFDKPDYTKEEKEFVYDQIEKLVEIWLMRGKSVVIDGTFYRKALRKRFIDISKGLKVPIKIVECVCGENVVEKRMGCRRGDPSDADFCVYKKVKSQWEPIKEKHITVDTTWDMKKVLEKIFGDVKSL
jgi:hypothetical protein